MLKSLREWARLGIVLSQLNATRFDDVLDAVKRIVAAERVMAEVPEPDMDDGLIGDIVRRFKN